MISLKELTNLKIWEFVSETWRYRVIGEIATDNNFQKINQNTLYSLYLCWGKQAQLLETYTLDPFMTEGPVT